MRDYLFINDTDDAWKVYDPSISHANDYRYAFTYTDTIVPLTTVSQGIRTVGCILFCLVPAHDISASIDNKLSLVSRSSSLTFSRDQEGFFVPSVCPGSLSLSGIFS